MSRQGIGNGEFTTVFGSLDRYSPGEIEVIDDDPKNYARSNVFAVAAASAPYEKVVVGKSLQYVIETLRAEGSSDWFAASHDEFALIMDGVVEIDLVKLDAPEQILEPGSGGSVKVPGEPSGTRMGRLVLRRGHQALLPQGAAYRFRARPGVVGVIVLQTLLGKHSVQKWSKICAT